ncbi:MAG: L,D-transpeptidase [Myxococcota bacterium]
MWWTGFAKTGAVVMALGLVSLSTFVLAQEYRADLEPAVPAPSWGRSIEVVDDGAPLMLRPDAGSTRRGTVRAGTRLGFEQRVFGKGCSTGVWYQTRDGLFICETHVRPSTAPPGVAPSPTIDSDALLPQRYAFVRVDGTRAFHHPSDYFANDYVEALGRGFGIVVTGEKVYEGVEFVRTRKHTWIEKASLRFVRGSPFRGATIPQAAPLDVAWVRPSAARVFDRPGGRTTGRLERHTLVHVEGVRRGMAKLHRGGWVRTRDLAQARLEPPPEGVGPDDRWIDVDVDAQVLVAYVGERPVFATLVSSGRANKASATPLGVFALWAKLDYTDMDDVERTDVPMNYSIQDVPWVQFFKGSYGFHAAFWHDDFGRRRSHGCINLSPADARTLFQFTEPVLPPGWAAILALPDDKPTLVRVH